MSRLPGRPRIIIDCNTFIQGFAFGNSPAAEILRLVERGEIELHLSRLILAELRRVVAYEEVRAISANMTSLRVDAILERLSFRATMAKGVRRVFEFERDPNDEPYLNLAIAVKADYLISWDKDLRWLMTGHMSVCKQFRRKSHPLKILDPVAFLNAVGQPWRSKGK